MRLLLILLCVNYSLPAFSQPQQEIKSRIDSLVKYIENKAVDSFALHTVYRDDDQSRKWKDVYDPANMEELTEVKSILKKMEKALASCAFQKFNLFKKEVQSEGTWYVYTIACGKSKMAHLSFLKVNGKYVLGDIDVEDEEEN